MTVATRLSSVVLTTALALIGCGDDDLSRPLVPQSPPSVPPPAEDPPNVLLVILDDVGVWDVAGYGATDPARTPTLDRLATSGTVFERCWSMPVCASSRAVLMTGEYPFRHGIGASGLKTVGLNSTATTYLPAHLPVDYAKALIGKWHLSARTPSEPSAPLTFGFDHHSGIMSNVRAVDGETYELWPKVENGVELGLQRSYITTDQIDEAVEWIGARFDPWLCILSLTAAHKPFERPPAALVPTSANATEREIFLAMIEAADLELGRLLAAVDEDVLRQTVVIVVGDNGSFAPVKPPELERKGTKTSVSEGGIRVPLVFCGRGIPIGRRVPELVGFIDLWATLIDLCGGEPPGTAFGVDSRTMLPLIRGDGPGPTEVKGHQYSEYFLPVGATRRSARTRWRRAVSDGRWKLVETPSVRKLFDLALDPLEDDDLYSTAEFRLVRERLKEVLLGFGGASTFALPPGGGG